MSRPAELTGTLWPIHLKPLDDELLSSWMVRLARAYDVKPVWFWRLFWPVDFREIDTIAAGGLLGLLAAKTATSVERTVQTTLIAIAQNNSIAGGLRYCPACLAGDPEPYFRRRWKMPFLLLCECHSLRLIEGCHHCRQPLKPEFVTLAHDSIAWCSHCGHDLRTAAGHAVTRNRAYDQVLGWQKRLRHSASDPTRSQQYSGWGEGRSLK